AGEQLADREAQPRALRLPAVRRLLDERLAHPRLDLLLRDQLGQRERREAERRHLATDDRLRMLARPEYQSAHERAVAGGQRGVVDRPGRGLLDGPHRPGATR